MLLIDLKHQGHAQRLTQRAVLQRRVPHAYLFHGPDGVGKEKLALGLAQLFLCSEPVEQGLQGEQAEAVGLERLRTGCGRCEDCRALVARTHPDLHLVYRQLNREHPDPEVRKRKALEIGVDVLRHFVIDKVARTPLRGRAKVFIVREADRITVQAQNGMLKTLEEPPGTTFIILLVTTLDRLLPTTLSRCQTVRFNALPTEFVRAKLAAFLPELPAEQVEWYARCSDGSAGLALSYANDNLYELNRRLLEGFAQSSGTRSDGLVKLWINESKALGDGYRKRDPDITDTEAGRKGLKTVFQLAATRYADILRFGSLSSVGSTRQRQACPVQSVIVNTAWRAQIERAANDIDPRQAVEAINRIARAERQLDLNANTQLCVETLLNDLARIRTG